MSRRRFNPSEVSYEYEIGYSQGIILFDLLFGVFLIIGGISLSFWIESWIGIFWPLVGLFLIWQAIKRFRQQGPQIKIGRHGIWTIKTQFLPWGRVLPIVKMEVDYRSVATYLILFNRFNQQQELVRLNTRDLDIDTRMLKAYIQKIAPKL